MRPPDVPLFLDRLTDEADYAVIGPIDGRRQVTDTRRAPYAAVCHVERNFGDGRWSGCTGFLVSPRVVVTAGHCTYSPVRRRLGAPATPRAVRVTPGRSGETEPPFGTISGGRWFAHRRYMARAARPFDLGVVVLQRPVSGIRPLALRAFSDTALRRIRQTRLLHISGYPSDKARGTQWRHEERLDRKTERDLFYSVDTCPGHSGAPVWVEHAAALPHVVVGVHTAGPPPHPGGPWGCRPGVPMAPQGQMNRGVRLTPEVVRSLNAFIDGGVGADFVQVGGAEA